MAEIKVEIADENDVGAIAEIAYQVAKIHDEAMPEYFKPVPQAEQLKNIQEIMKDDKVIVFKAVGEEKICGFLFLEMVHRVSAGLAFSKLGCVLNLGVDKTYQRQGIGTLLLKFAEQYVRHQGGEAIDLSVFAFNKDAIKLYERLDYQVMDVSMRKILK